MFNLSSIICVSIFLLLFVNTHAFIVMFEAEKTAKKKCYPVTETEVNACKVKAEAKHTNCTIDKSLLEYFGISRQKRFLIEAKSCPCLADFVVCSVEVFCNKCDTTAQKVVQKYIGAARTMCTDQFKPIRDMNKSLCSSGMNTSTIIIITIVVVVIVVIVTGIFCCCCLDRNDTKKFVSQKVFPAKSALCDAAKSTGKTSQTNSTLDGGTKSAKTSKSSNKKTPKK